MGSVRPGRLWWAVLIVMMLLAAGCYRDGENRSLPGTEQREGRSVIDSSKDGGDDRQDGAKGDFPLFQEGRQEITLELYFADNNLVNSGERGEYGYVKPVRRTLPYCEGVLRLALEELIRGPRPEDGAVGRTLPATTRIMDIEIKDGVALVNLSAEVIRDSSGGTTGGAVFMQSLVYTATQFLTVNSLQVLVQGDPWCDGHTVWSEPLGRADLFPGSS